VRLKDTSPIEAETYCEKCGHNVIWYEGDEEYTCPVCEESQDGVGWIRDSIWLLAFVCILIIIAIGILGLPLPLQ
jgi:hypothetical protein